MAFFDTLKSKTISMGNQVTDLARNSSEQWKLEGEIKKLNSEIEATYAAIGKAVFDARMSGETPADPEEQIQTILDLKKQIEEREQKIDEIKSRIPCPNCGKIMPAGTKFCTFCGKPMEKPEEEPVREGELHCPNCGKPVLPTHAFCMNCGAKLQVPEPEPEAPAAPEEAAASYAEEPAAPEWQEAAAPAAEEPAAPYTEPGAAPYPEAPAAPEWFEDKAPTAEEPAAPYTAEPAAPFQYESPVPGTDEGQAPGGEF